MNKYKTLTCNIHPGFDALPPAANEPSTRQPKGTPHCDCLGSNRAFFGKHIKEKSDPYEAYHMVPVTPVTGGSCPYCGYHAPLLVPVNEAELRERGGRKKIGSKGDVIGTNTATGQQVHFESALAASRAGYGKSTSIHYAVHNGTPHLGWKWQRVKDRG